MSQAVLRRVACTLAGVVLVPLAASAQSTNTVSVVGHATMSVVADDARIAMRFSGANDAGAVSLMRSALERSGMTNVRIDVPVIAQPTPIPMTYNLPAPYMTRPPSPQPAASGTPSVVATTRYVVPAQQFPFSTAFIAVGLLHAPTVEKIRAVVQAANAAVTGDAAPRLAQIGVVYGIADCAGLERRLTEAASADARKRASDLANDNHVTLGRITGINAAQVYQSQQCSANLDQPTPYLNYDPNGTIPSPQITVQQTVAMSYLLENR